MLFLPGLLSPEPRMADMDTHGTLGHVEKRLAEVGIG
jgi:hypothetical protein